MEIKFKVGTYVKIKHLNAIGRVLGYKKNKIQVEINNITFEIDEADIREVSQIFIQKDLTFQKQPVIKLLIEDFSVVKEIDLHGLSIEEAISRVEKFIDNAIVKHIKTLKIIHGKGSGKLRTHIREYLKLSKYIKKIYDDNMIFQGGSGVTIIELDI